MPRRRVLRRVHVIAALLLSASSASQAVTPTPTPRRPARLAFTSDPRDYLGGGQQREYTDADGHFSAHYEHGWATVDFVANGVDDYWSLTFQAPRDQPLTPGVYEGANNAPSPHRPGINVSGEHRFCSFVTGRFVVLEADFSAEGDVDALAIDFELRCENADPLFAGFVRINSEQPPPPTRTPTATPRPDRVVLEIDSDPGDYVGSGRQRTILAGGSATSQYYLYPFTDARPHVNFQLGPFGTGPDWDLTFASPICGDLVPGTFTGATVTPWELPWAPGMNVIGEGRGCGELTGEFVIRDAVYGEDGEIYRFVVDFDQRCALATGALHGSLSYNSLRPSPTPGRPTPTPTDYSSIAAVYSQLGDFIGHCRGHYFTLSDGDFYASHDERGVAIDFVGGGGNLWRFEFGAPRGSELVPGTYKGAVRAAFRQGGQPGLDVSGEGRGCDRIRGQFVIHEVVFGTGDTVERFAADFEQHCEGVTPTLYGSIHYHSSLPPPTPRAPDAPKPTPALAPCWGDCAADGAVRIDDLILGIAIALGLDEIDQCPNMDQNHDGRVTINDILYAVSASLDGCDPTNPP